MNTFNNTAVVLELAPLPREQIGPFLLLGVDKTADTAAIEEHWADRLKWARRDLIKVPLEDINWAREILSDSDKRLRADAASFNLDTANGILRDLSRQFGKEASTVSRCNPIDVEKNLADYSPTVDIPDLDMTRSTIAIPPIPHELPAAREILEKFVREPLDPWNLPVSW